jgi:hypothetical protein
MAEKREKVINRHANSRWCYHSLQQNTN